MGWYAAGDSERLGIYVAAIEIAPRYPVPAGLTRSSAESVASPLHPLPWKVRISQHSGSTICPHVHLLAARSNGKRQPFVGNRVANQELFTTLAVKEIQREANGCRVVSFRVRFAPRNRTDDAGKLLAVPNPYKTLWIGAGYPQCLWMAGRNFSSQAVPR